MVPFSLFSRKSNQHLSVNPKNEFPHHSCRSSSESRLRFLYHKTSILIFSPIIKVIIFSNHSLKFGKKKCIKSNRRLLDSELLHSICPCRLCKNVQHSLSFMWYFYLNNWILMSMSAWVYFGNTSEFRFVWKIYN